MTLRLKAGANLQPYNSMAIPARADFLVSVSTVAELREAISLARRRERPFLVLGEGSNTIFRADFPGVVILNRMFGIDITRDTSDVIEIRVAAGENWHGLVEHAVDQGWFGLENLALIPGMVGAAPIQNIGAYGAEVEDVITEVRFLDTLTGAESTLPNHECEFAYRDSIFKHSLADRSVITSVGFRLSKIANCNVSYAALASELAADPRPRQVFDAVCRIRSAKLPDPKTIPNAGSFFKNPVIDEDDYQQLLERYPDLIAFNVGGRYKLAAGWLIENAGWKDRSIAGVCVHSDQALVIVNPEYKSGEDVLNFAAAIQSDILLRYGVNLEIEPRII